MTRRGDRDALEKKDRGGQEAAGNGATSRSESRFNFVMLVALKRGNHLGEVKVKRAK